MIAVGLAFARSHWKGLLVALAFAALGLKLLAAQGEVRHLSKQLESCQQARKLDQETVRRKTAEAQAADAAKVIKVEREQNAITQEKARDFETKRNAIRRHFAGSVRPQAGADKGSVGSPAGAEATEPAGPIAGAGGEAIVPTDDLRICAENTLRAITWLEWWKEQERLHSDEFSDK